MRIRKVKIGIKDTSAALDEFINTAKAMERGEKVTKKRGVYFTSIDALRKVLTPQRLGLLHVIREAKPSSLHEVARLANRNIKNVFDDIRYLAQVGFVELKEADNKVSARVNYDKIFLEIAV